MVAVLQKRDLHNTYRDREVEIVRLSTYLALLAGALGVNTAFAVGPEGARVGGAAALSAQPADPSKQGDGTMSPAARAAIEGGPLPASADAVAAKAAANATSDEAARAGKLVAPDCADLSPAGEPAPPAGHCEPESQ
jgi:hypothetical protein